jgi:hypothetical protein
MHRALRYVLPLLILAGAATSASAQTVLITTDPSNAGVYTVTDAGLWTLLGTGSAKFKLDKKSTNRIWVTAEGFDTTTTTFDTGKQYPKTGVLIRLDTMIVKVTALPYDAGIYANGALSGRSTASVKVPRGAPVTVEVKKAGFKTLSRVYHFDTGAEKPPVTDRFEMKERMVRVTTAPEGATFKVDGNSISTGKEAEVVVPTDQCVTVVAEREGYKPKEKKFCDRPGSSFGTDETIVFTDRMINLTATPSNADIKVNDRVMAQGVYSVFVANNGCVMVEVVAKSYAKQKRQICAADDPPANLSIDLPFDESYTSSVQSDQANVNFTIEVSPKLTPDAAWRVISQVILGKFDVLEITDKETGYMRTAWEVTKFNHSLVRTRVIVKLGDSNPLKYVVKVNTEHSDDETATVKDDEKFQEWDRVLNSYKDLISELQGRLR